MIGELPLTRMQFSTVLVFPAVVEECRLDTERLGTSAFSRAQEDGWIDVKKPDDPPLVRRFRSNSKIRSEYGTIPLSLSIVNWRFVMEWRTRIETKPEVLAGKPVVSGTRIPVELVIELLAQDWSTEEILDQYPALSSEDIRACLHYASETLHSERVYPVKSASTS